MAAIIAPLSVHSARRGQERPPAGRGRGLGDPRPQPRVGGHAAADAPAPARRRRRRRRAACRPAGRPPPPGTTRRRRRRATSGSRRTWLTTAVFRPGEREVGLAGHRAREAHRGRVALAARAGRSPGRPGSRARGSARPCRTPRPRRRRRSGRAPGSAPCVLHHDDHRVAARHDQHRERRLERRAPRATPRAGAPRGGSRRRTAGRPRARAPSPRSRRRAARRRARARGTRRPRRASPSSTPASTSASAITGVTSSTCARLAISGTTPPKRACRSTWLDTTDERTIAAVLDDRGRGLVARRLDARGSSVTGVAASVDDGLAGQHALDRVEQRRRTRAGRCRAPTSPARPRWPPGSSSCARRPARTRTGGTSPARRCSTSAPRA